MQKQPVCNPYEHRHQNVVNSNNNIWNGYVFGYEQPNIRYHEIER